MAELKEQYSKTIRTLIPIYSLSSQRQDELIERAEIIRLPTGRYLFRQGDRDEFSFYLLEGELQMKADGQVESTVRSGSDSALYPLAQLQPRQFSAQANTAIQVLKIGRSDLDRLLVMEQNPNDIEEMLVSDIDVSDGPVDWITHMLQSDLFARLPTAMMHQLFAAMEPVNYEAGSVVVEQGEPGDFYYIIQDGSCEVFRRKADGKQEIRLAELMPGDGFGEEALLADMPRSASVRMRTDGILMRMNKNDFIDLIKKPALEQIDYAAACKKVAGGAVWLDVRLPEEHRQAHIRDSVNVPLNELRGQSHKLAADKTYIVYCDTGGRSLVATFLLTQHGYHVSCLNSGILNCPDAQLVEGERTPQTSAGADNDADTTAADNYINPYARAQDQSEADRRVAEYAAMEQKLREQRSKLEADRKQAEAESRRRLEVEEERIRKLKSEAEAQLRQEKRALESARSQNEAEKQRLVKLNQDTEERLRKANEQAEAEIRRRHEEEEARIRQLRAEAEQQLKLQKRELDAAHSRAAEETRRLLQLKQEAEDQIRQAREKADADSTEAQQRIQEAEALKQQLNEARQAIEKEAENHRRQQSAQAKKVWAAAQDKLESEQRRLAEEYQRSNEALEEARREKAAAEAAREAANNEAQRIIEQFKKDHEQARAQEEAELQAERGKLERQAREIQAALASIQEAKDKAEAMRQAAEEQAAELKAQLRREKKRKNSTLEKRIKAAEAEIQQSRQDLKQAQAAQQATAAAQQDNIKGFERQLEKENSLRTQIEVEISEWLAANQPDTTTRAQQAQLNEHIRAIEARARQAKESSKKAAQSLLDEISSQLGGDKKP